MTAEEYISSQLDGNFWTFDFETNRTHCERVPKDFLPILKVPYTYSVDKKTDIIRRKDWTPEEDDRIMDLRAANVSWDHIQKKMRRGLERIRARYAELCAERGTPERKMPRKEYQSWSPAFKEQIRQMRADGAKLKPLSRQTGVTVWSLRLFLEDEHPLLLDIDNIRRSPRATKISRVKQVSGVKQGAQDAA